MEDVENEEWRTHLQQGNALLRARNYEAADAEYDEAIRLKPKAAIAYRWRGRARAALGDLTNALVDYDIALNGYPNSKEIYYDRGIARRDSGDVLGAIADFTHVIYLDSQDHRAYFLRGKLYAQTFEESLRLNSTSAGTYNNRAIVRESLGDLDGALDDYEQSVKLDDTDPNTYFNRGQLYVRLGNWDQAHADFRQAYQLGADSDISAGLAITHHALGNLHEARELWRGLLAQDGRYADADWVGKELNWAAPLVEEARKLIAGL